MPIKKWLRPWARKTELTKEVKPRLAIVESIMMKVSPKWNWKKYVKGMTLIQACEEEWITAVTFRNWRNEDKKIGDYYNNLLQARKEMVHSMIETAAMNNVLEVINWDVKVRPMDKANLSMRYLEKTDPTMNPSIKFDWWVEKNPILGMSRQEMEQRIIELSTSLNLKWKIVEYDNIRTIELSAPISTENSPEQTWDGETTENE